MRHRRTQGIAPLGALAVLMGIVGCGGPLETGGAGAANTVDPADYVAAAAADHWVYEDTTTSTGMVVHAVGAATVAGRSGILQRSTTHPLADRWQTGGAAEALLVPGTATASRVPATGSAALDLALGPVDLYRLPATIGSSFVQADLTVDGPVDGDGDGVADRWALQSTVTVVGRETVTVAAGRFDDCLHLRTVIDQRVTLSSNAQVRDSRTTRDEWYAPGIGAVRMDTTTVSGPVTGTSRLQLAAWRVGGQSSDASAPSILQVTPVDGYVGVAPAALQVKFSEAVDPASARAGVGVVDGAGQPVAGTVSGSGADVAWTPQVPLVAGHYTLQIAASVLDVAGRPLGSALGVRFDVSP